MGSTSVRNFIFNAVDSVYSVISTTAVIVVAILVLVMGPGGALGWLYALLALGLGFAIVFLGHLAIDAVFGRKE